MKFNACSLNTIVSHLLHANQTPRRPSCINNTRRVEKSTYVLVQVVLTSTPNPQPSTRTTDNTTHDTLPIKHTQFFSPVALRDQHFHFRVFAFLMKISGQNENDHAGLLGHPFEIL